MDLLRAVIIGAAGTPYQDGLFFFDIHLPTEYPHSPPVSLFLLQIHLKAIFIFLLINSHLMFYLFYLG